MKRKLTDEQRARLSPAERERVGRQERLSGLYQGPAEPIKPIKLPAEVLELIEPLGLSVRSAMRYAATPADVLKILRDRHLTGVADRAEAIFQQADGRGAQGDGGPTDGPKDGAGEKIPEAYRDYPTVWRGMSADAKAAAIETERLEKRMAERQADRSGGKDEPEPSDGDGES